VQIPDQKSNDDSRPSTAYDFYIDIRPIREMLRELPVAIYNRIDRDYDTHARLANSFEGLPAILKLKTRLAAITFDAIIFLVTDYEVPGRRPEFALVVTPMTRTIIDDVFNVVYIFDDPVENAKWWYRSGWREAMEVDAGLREAHGNEPKWDSFLTEHARWVEWMASDAKVTSEQKANPKKVSWWPVPGAMVDPGRAAVKDPARLAFLTELKKHFYSRHSQDSHGSLLGITRAALLDEHVEERAEHLMTYKTKVLLDAVTAYLELLSEIVVEARLPFEASRLLRAWRHIEQWPDAKHLLGLRYGSLLELLSAEGRNGSR
jgi:hypothetical protein